MARRQFGKVLQHLRRLVNAGSGMQAALSDSELVRRYCNTGDEAAFQVLLERYSSLVYNVCHRVTGTVHDAEDAFQATFLVLACKAGSIRRKEAVGSWLYGVAYRIAYKAKIKAIRRRDCEKQMVDMLNHPAPALWHDLQPVLDQELSRLPDKYRKPIILRYLQGMSNAEASRELNCPPGTFSWRLANALELLRQRLARHGVLTSTGALAGILTEQAVSAAVPVALKQTTLDTALLFASGATAVAVGVEPTVIALTKGALQTMWLDRLKLGLGLLLLGLMSMGLGGLVLRTSAGGATAPIPDDIAALKMCSVVNGRKLCLQLSREETTLHENGIHPGVDLQVNFKNVGDQPLKLDTYVLCIATYRFMRIWGPDGKELVWKPTAPAPPLPPNEGNFPVLQPGQSWEGAISSGYWASGFKLDKAGSYRLQLKYEGGLSSKVYPDLAKGCWTGSITSNEVTLLVKLPDK